MATKKDKDRIDPKDYHGITITVGGKVLGKIKSWKAAVETKPGEVHDYIPTMTMKRPPLPNEVTLALPEAIRDLWDDPYLFHASGKCALGRSIPKGPVHPDADLILKAQLEMWGMDKGEIPVPTECVVRFVQLIEELGYTWWIDSEASMDEELLETQGVVVEHFDINYVSQGEKE